MFLPHCGKSAHPGALPALEEIYNAEDIDKAQLAIKEFEIDSLNVMIFFALPMRRSRNCWPWRR
jgi:hypothetical protein